MGQATATSQPPANVAKAITVLGDKNTLKGFLDSENFKESLRDIATKYFTADRVVKVALLAASRQPKLFACTPQSFLQSVIKGAELGLEFGGATGQGYLVPYKNKWLSGKAGRDVYEAQFIPGYRGFIELAYRSGNVTYIDVQLVYEKDHFDYGFNYGGEGKTPFIQHKPCLTGDRGKLLCAYSVIGLKESPFPKIDFMTVEELEQIRNSSKSKDDGPWKTWPAEMQKKSVIRRSIKWIRTTPEITAAEEADNTDYDLGSGMTVDTSHQIGTEGCKRRLAAAIQGQPVIDATDPTEVTVDASESQAGDAPDMQEESNQQPPEPTLEEQATELFGPGDTEPTSKYVCPQCKKGFKTKPARGKCPDCGAEVKELDIKF